MTSENQSNQNTKVNIQTTPFALQAYNGKGYLIYTVEELGQTKNVTAIPVVELNSLDIKEGRIGYRIKISQEEFLKFFSHFIENKCQEFADWVEGCRVKKLSADSNLEFSFQYNSGSYLNYGIHLPDNFGFKINFDRYYRADWQQNFVNFYVLGGEREVPEKI